MIIDFLQKARAERSFSVFFVSLLVTAPLHTLKFSAVSSTKPRGTANSVIDMELFLARKVFKRKY